MTSKDTMTVQTIQWVKGTAKIIDQTRLPGKLEYLYCRDAQDMWKAIKRLAVRGAPAIGVAGAFGVLLGTQGYAGASRSEFMALLRRTVRYLGTSRPTAVNLFAMLTRMEHAAHEAASASVAQLKGILFAEAMAIFEEDRQVCRAMGDHGAALIQDGMTALTVCNAGALATVDYGTALGVFYSAKRQGRKFKVVSCETRPLLQGARLTCWELSRHGIDTTLITDNMAASLMQQGKIDMVLTGADRIARNGDSANKIGTYMLAVLAKHHALPFYVVAPRSTFDFSIAEGKQIPIEERQAQEVTGFGGVRTAPRGIKVHNPAFDVTPAKLITGIVTEHGIFAPAKVKQLEGLPAAVLPQI